MQNKLYYEFEHQAMATRFSIQIVGEEYEDAETASMLCFQRLDALELVLSRFVPDSDISRINRMKSGDELLLDFETWDVLKKAIAIHQKTDGAFDIGVAEYVDVFRATKQGILSDFEMANAMQSVFKKAQNASIYVDPETPKIYCVQEGMTFDLGAIGKGFALDQLSELLEEMSIKNYVINAGNSSVLAKGVSKNASCWSFPISSTHEEFAVQLNNSAVSATGTFFQGDHIFDPRIGQNVCNSLYERVWVSSQSAALSDAYSTACFLLEKEQLNELLQNNPEIAWIAISENGKIQFFTQKNIPLAQYLIS